MATTCMYMDPKLKDPKLNFVLMLEIYDCGMKL